ncbi:uncharacterized protein LOC120657568 [Panicum virgatum]|uniref:uncharacterized protein LOC120657568 n=1 Tax=Panicum virgatum TaxID=38727 RepID=UPI0019D6745D|nr:uncharacterized protein LOC120657568 [Panicum virgatum]
MAGSRWTRRPSAALLLLLCALLCAVLLFVPAARRGEDTERFPVAAASSSSWGAGGRRALPQPAAVRSRRFRARGRWNSAGLGDSKHEVPSGPNPDSNSRGRGGSIRGGCRATVASPAAGGSCGVSPRPNSPSTEQQTSSGC